MPLAITIQFGLLYCAFGLNFRLQAGEVTCLVGVDAPHPQDIPQVVKCGAHEKCSLEQYVTPSGSLRYSAKCKDVVHCQGASVSSPNQVICSQCCTQDLCAASLCGNSGYPNNTGPVCYQCTYPQDAAGTCDNIAVCNEHEVCSTYVDDDGKYRLGCMTEKQCNSTMDTSSCARCCSAQMCNDDCDVTNITHVSPCQNSPCQHGACIVNGSKAYTCHCDVGYGGIKCDKKIQDCKAALDFNITSPDGIYLALLPGDVTLTHLSCDMVTDGGGWTVILNRASADLDFVHQTDTDYALGFGDIRQNFWLGLENMHKLTNDSRHYQLRVELQLNSSTNQSPTFYQLYDDFSVGNRRAFNLHVGSSRGSAGDSLSGHNGFGFSTIFPVTNDYDSNPTSCANYMQGNWWFHNCADSCLTCAYMTPGIQNCRAMAWNALGYCVALKSARMMVRPL